ncbi:hypothetical protein EDC18_102401 [Natranaerovirga pectinivora]|uniref:Uncharacterized protein n=1 Tax=Natranaerovirga pectinivora TaxID=682400 RepID=A0A4R3MPC1_9FIRM|nr:hypothetical protein [Natranaerovirga pectinivora]TCT16382.1 hypothetical protein EDC18_102401 [Natranaerovirga pectinivora]
MLENKLQEIKTKLDVKETNKQEEVVEKVKVNVPKSVDGAVTRDVLKEELEIIQQRIFKGISKVMRERFAEVNSRLDKFINMAGIDNKHEEIYEHIEKLKELLKE